MPLCHHRAAHPISEENPMKSLNNIAFLVTVAIFILAVITAVIFNI
jgi:hypothetical protein